MVTTSEPGPLIRCRQYRVDFRSTEERDQRLPTSLGWNSEHALDLSRRGGFFIRRVVKERADRREAKIATAGRNPAARFQVIEKRRDQRRVDRGEGQTGRRCVQA